MTNWNPRLSRLNSFFGLAACGALVAGAVLIVDMDRPSNAHSRVPHESGIQNRVQMRPVGKIGVQEGAAAGGSAQAFDVSTKELN